MVTELQEIGATLPTAPALRYAAPALVPEWGWKELRAAIRCAATGRFVRGVEGDRLARSARSMLGVRHVLPVNRGRVAIFLALKALDIGERDDVVLPAYLCATVSGAVRRAGARVVLADVDAGLHMTVESVLRAITPRTKCVIVPHLYGNVAPVDAIERALAGSGVALIDDAAQSFGARCDGRLIGTYGRCGIVSISLGKSLCGAAGGLLVTDDSELFAKAEAQPLSRERPSRVARRVLATWIWHRLRRFTLPLKRTSDRLFSHNYASHMRPCVMSNMDGSIALELFSAMYQRAFRRRALARRVLASLGDASRRCLSDLSESSMVLELVFLLPVSGPTTEEAMTVLARSGIEGRTGYTPLYLDTEIPAPPLPNTEELWQRVLLVPVSQALENRTAREALRRILL